MLLLQAFVGSEGLTACISVEMCKLSSRSLHGLKCPAAMCFARTTLVGLSSLRAAKLTSLCRQTEYHPPVADACTSSASGPILFDALRFFCE
jgi:hypothetical protein